MNRVLCAVDLSDISVEVVHDAQATVQGYGAPDVVDKTRGSLESALASIKRSVEGS